MHQMDEPDALSWLRGFPALETCQVSLREDGTISRRQVPDPDDHSNDNNNNADADADVHQAPPHKGDASLETHRSPSAALLAKLQQEQDVMKGTFVAFRRWAMDATKTLRTLEARAESAERRARVNQAEVLRLQELLAQKERQAMTRKRKMEWKDGKAKKGAGDDGADHPEDEASSGDSDDIEDVAVPDRKQSECRDAKP